MKVLSYPIKYCAIDSGFGYMKAVSQEREIIFNNIVSLGEIRHFGDNTKTDDMGIILKNIDITFEYNGFKRHYWIGETACKHGANAEYVDKKDRWNTEEGRATFLAALALLCDNDEESFIVATGLPMEDFKTPLRKEYEENITGTHSVTFNSGPLEGTTRVINLVAIKVFPQGLGVFLDQLLTKDGGQVEQHELMHPNLAFGLIDVGTRTTNIGLYEDMEMSEQFSFSIEHGMGQVHSKLKAYLGEQGMQVKDRDIDKILWIDRFKNVNIAQKRKELLTELADQIYQAAANKWQEKAFLSTIFIGGGGGEAVYNYLGFSNKKLVDQPQFANANGFYKAVVAMNIAEEVGNNEQERNCDAI